ncbi:O-antigen ligase family protein [Solibacillus sp. FSL K6-1523]|uniref:O-antigen ligase family protein n=1 Tax=Solibacillus sp. FSL K6-1523 TaxID=2921471 RepID=UPI0030FCA225
MTSFYQELNQSGKMSDEKENAQSRAGIDKWIFRLLLLLIGVMPLIVLANIEQVVSPLISNIDVLSSGAKGDLFTHYKALFVIVITVITGVMLLAKVFFMDGKIRKTPMNYAIGLFAFAIIISTVFSPNITVALNGQYNRSDGAISWLCYLALMFIAMNIEYPKNVVKYIMYALMPFVFINLFIITMNFYGKDLLQYEWMQSLVSMALPEGASISEGSTLVGTLNQWNYMSGMFAIMTVMYLAWAFIEKSMINTVVSAITAAVSISVMFMSISTNGFLTVTVSLIVLIVIAIKSPVKKNMAVGLLLFVVITMPVFHILATENEQVWDESFGFILGGNPYKKVEKTNVSFDDLLGSKAYASDQILELPILPEQGWSPGSGRFYIWEKSADLVKERPIVGYGLDTLIYNFPHFNIDARGGNNSESTIVDKAHNVYVTILYGTGIFGALAFLIILVGSVLVGLKQIVLKNNLILGPLVAVIVAYSTQALFNDSLPGITAVIFVLIGILFGIQKEEGKTQAND